MRLKVKREREQNSPQHKRFISSVCANKTLAEAELKSKLRLPLINNKKLMMLNILWGSREKQIPHGNGVYDKCVECCQRNFLRGSSKVTKRNQFICIRFENWCGDAFSSIFRKSVRCCLLNDTTGTIKIYPLIMRSF